MRYSTVDDYGFDYYDRLPVSSVDVLESGPSWTGLVDPDGYRIMRFPDPIGFNIERAIGKDDTTEHGGTQGGPEEV